MRFSHFSKVPTPNNNVWLQGNIRRKSFHIGATWSQRTSTQDLLPDFKDEKTMDNKSLVLYQILYYTNVLREKNWDPPKSQRGEHTGLCLCLMVKDIHDRHGTISNIFGPYLRDLLLKIWEIYKKLSNSVSFWARKIFFFLNGSEFRQKLIGTIIRVLVRHPHA